MIVLIKNAHFDAADFCGRGYQLCDVQVKLQIGGKTWTTKFVRSDRPEWNEEINVDFDVKHDEIIHFSIWSGKPGYWLQSSQRIGNFSIDLLHIFDQRISGKPNKYGFGKSASFVEIVISWNNKYEHGYFAF